MNKKFSPVRIQNPTTLHQFVKVCPGQQISMYLEDKIYGEYVVDVSTDLLEFDSKPHKNGMLYTIKHSESIHEWAEYSSSMIGEIWIDGKNSIGKVGVLLETTNEAKTDVKTVVNPDSLDLRMYPYDVLELVVYDNRFGFHDEWNFNWKPTKDVGLEQLGYDHLCFNSWENYYDGLEPSDYLYCRYPRGYSKNGLMTRQHHFWFRLDNKSFILMAKENSIVHVGNIVINGISNRFQLQHASKMSYNLSLYVDFRKKCYKKLQDSIDIKKRNEYLPQIYRPIVQKPKLPEIRDVSIKSIDTLSYTGCKVLSALNNSYKPNNWDQWESDIYFQECNIDCAPIEWGYFNKNHNQSWRKLD